MLRKWLCQADVTLRLHPVDPVLIKSGYATIDGPDMVPVSTVKDGRKVYYFPGTSLKGCLRSHLERIARTLKEASVCIPYFDPEKKNIPVPVAAEARSHGCGFDRRDAPKAQAYRDSCAVCRMFGSLKFGGRFSIGDAYPLEGAEHPAPRLEQRNGVGIDRFTGGTVPGLLFDLQVLVGGTFEARARLENFELWQLAALNFLLRDLCDELVPLGSGRSRGLGRVRGEVADYRLTYLRPMNCLEGIATLVNPEESEEYGLHRWTPQPIELPAPRQLGLRHEYDLSSDWERRLGSLAESFAVFLEAHGGPAKRPSVAANQ